VLHGIGRRHSIGDLLGLIFLRLLGELRGGGDAGRTTSATPPSAAYRTAAIQSE
jgi:hypothetical protein